MRPGSCPPVRMITILLATCLLLTTGCNALSPFGYRVPSTSTSTPTPTEYPIIMCTPPLCWEDEVFSCPAKCPGGCGTMCATRTPDPNASPTPTFPTLSVICPLPTPDPEQSGPRLAVCSSASEIHLNGLIQVAAEFSGVAYLNRIDITGQNVDGPGSFYLITRRGDHLPTVYNEGAVVSVIFAQTHADQIFLVLQAVSPGSIKIDFRVIPTVPDVRSSLTLTVLP